GNRASVRACGMAALSSAARVSASSIALSTANRRSATFWATAWRSLGMNFLPAPARGRRVPSACFLVSELTQVSTEPGQGFHAGEEDAEGEGDQQHHAEDPSQP